MFCERWSGSFRTSHWPMGWMWPGNSFSPFAIKEWSKGLSATHGDKQQLLQGQAWSHGLPLHPSSWGRGTRNWQRYPSLERPDHSLFGKLPSCVHCSYDVKHLPSLRSVSGAQRSPDISIFLIADLWCARRPALCHSSLWGGFVPGQARTQAVRWPKLQRSSSTVHWCLQESWGDRCVAK